MTEATNTTATLNTRTGRVFILQVDMHYLRHHITSLQLHHYIQLYRNSITLIPH